MNIMVADARVWIARVETALSCSLGPPKNALNDNFRHLRYSCAMAWQLVVEGRHHAAG
jgi:hypothetical protein